MCTESRFPQTVLQWARHRYAWCDTQSKLCVFRRIFGTGATFRQAADRQRALSSRWKQQSENWSAPFLRNLHWVTSPCPWFVLGATGAHYFRIFSSRACPGLWSSNTSLGREPVHPTNQMHDVFPFAIDSISLTELVEAGRVSPRAAMKNVDANTTLPSTKPCRFVLQISPSKHAYEFKTSTEEACKQWVEAIRKASYEAEARAHMWHQVNLKLPPSPTEREGKRVRFTLQDFAFTYASIDFIAYAVFDERQVPSLTADKSFQWQPRLSVRCVTWIGCYGQVRSSKREAVRCTSSACFP